jgi:pimeloyl-ACP methyl ester carboxylesterase
VPEVTNGGVRIHFEVVGSGPGLVLQHGFSQNLGHWREAGYVDELRDEYLIVLIDARGHGKSDKPHDPAAYSLHTLVADVLAVLDEIGEARAHFWEYSLGGAIGQCLGRDHPDRLLSLIIGGAGLPDQKPPATDPLVAQLERGIEAYVQAREALRGEPFPEPQRVLLLANDAQALIANRLGRQNEQSCIPTSNVACLIYAAESDVPEAERLFTQLPAATFLSLPGLNHSTAFSRSDLVLPHVKSFLDRVGVSGSSRAERM